MTDYDNAYLSTIFKLLIEDYKNINDLSEIEKEEIKKAFRVLLSNTPFFSE